jgi:hypothetical protein
MTILHNHIIITKTIIANIISNRRGKGKLRGGTWRYLLFFFVDVRWGKTSDVVSGNHTIYCPVGQSCDVYNGG